MGKGCKVLLIVGIILIAIVCIIIALLYINREKIGTALIDKSTDAIELQVLKDLPEGYQPDDIKAAFKDFKESLKSGALSDKLKAPKISAFATDIQNALKDKKIDKEELDKILEAMKDIVGK
jgi:hypothetical protein